MHHAHSTIGSRPAVARDAITPNFGTDVRSATNPSPQAGSAVRLLWGDHATIDECQVLSAATVDVVALRNGALLSRSFHGDGYLHLLVEGWAYRAYGLRDGARQITDVLVPGDICDWMRPEPNEETRASGPVRIAVLPRTLNEQQMQTLSALRDRTMVGDIRRLRAQLTSLGRRDAQERVAYCLADLHRRMERVGLAEGGAFACPLTQEQLGDLLGLTPVHVNRVVQRLRRDGLLTFGKRQVTILDQKRLHAIAGWQANIDEADAPEPGRRTFVLPREGGSMSPPSANTNSRGLS